MNFLDKIRKTAREAVTTPEIFVSKYMKEFIGSKLRLICRSFKVLCPDLKITFDPGSEVTAYTSLDNMLINSGHPMFDGEDDLRLLKVAGVLLHEIGHVLFTNYTAWTIWQEHILQGDFYPKTPDDTQVCPADRDRLLSLASNKLLQNVFLKYAFSLSNVLEDGRIENFLLRFVRNARFMTKGLVRLRQETYAEMPSFEELESKVDNEEMRFFVAIIQLVLHYARYREIKGNFDPHSDLGEVITDLMPDIDAYLDATSAVVCYDSFNRMMIRLSSVIEHELSDMLQEQTQSQEQSQQANGSGSAGDRSNQSQQDASGSTQQEESQEDASSQAQESSSDPNSESGTEGEGAKSGVSPSGSSSSESSSQPDESGSPVPDGSGMSGDEIEQLAGELLDSLQDMIDDLVGLTTDNSGNMGAQAKGSDRGSVSRRLSGLAKGKGGRVCTDQAAEAASGSGTISHMEASSDTNVDLTLQDIARKISDDTTEKLISDEIRKEYGNVSREVKDYSAIHRDADIVMFHYNDVTEEDIRRYNEIAQAISPLVKRAVKGSNFYEKDREVYVEDNLFSGRILHAEKAYRGDGRIFSKSFDREEPPMVALAVRIDTSGSMSGDRILAAQRCCVFLYEYALGMEKRYNVKIPLYIYGDCCRRDAEGVNMYVFADDKFRTPREKYRLMKLAAGGCNRDGLPIRMAVKRLEQEHPSAQKVLFNITDGQPNDRGYGGTPAFDDLRDITRYCEKKRIALASCAIGSDRELIESIYGSKHFLNISDLDELPVRLVRILKKLLK